MFLQVCVCPRGGGYISMPCRWYPSMPCSRSPGGVLSQHALQVVSQHALHQVSKGGVPAPSGVTSSGRSAPGGVCSPGRTPPIEADGYCCGRYASYWNAFLFTIQIKGKCTKSTYFSFLLKQSALS